MAAILGQPEFRISKDFDPIHGYDPIWKVQDERKVEFEEIIRLCSIHQAEFKKVVEKVQSHRANEVPRLPLYFFKSVKDETFCWFVEQTRLALDHRCHLVRFMLSMINKYKPLHVISDLEDGVKEVELGSSFWFHFEAVGEPKPSYEWFFMKEGTTSWTRLNFDHEYITFRDLEEGDCGFYQCQVRHCCGVNEKGLATEVPGIYSKCVEVKITPGSIFLQKDLEDVSSPYGGKIYLSVQAKSLLPLSYQWYRDENPLVGEDDLSLSIQEANFDVGGKYKCIVKNSVKAKETKVASVIVNIPGDEELRNNSLHFTNETILLLKHPELGDAGSKRAIGDRIILSCKAVCKYPLDYEWVRQGFVQDLIEKPREPMPKTAVEPISHTSPHMEDDIPPIPVSFWIYHCIVSCHETGQVVKTNPVRVQTSLSVNSMQKHPTFKIALIICVDQYKSDYFHKLNAPSNDGTMLAVTLRNMGFFVLSFVNLTKTEIEAAVRMYAKFIDISTYSVFYFNGHSIGNGEDLFLAAKDTTLDKSRPVPDDIVFLDAVEDVIDAQNPLLSLFIYDSCRERAPEDVIQYFTSNPRPVKPFKSSTIKAFGTRPAMINYGARNADGRYQGVYMKHLLKHIQDNCSVSQLFERVTDSFSRCEDVSIQERMLPEFKNSVRQILNLTAPCRSTKYTELQKRFFQTFKYEAMIEDSLRSSGFPKALSRDLGIARTECGSYSWVTGRSEGQEYQGVVSIQIRPGNFDNEAKLAMEFRWLCRDPLPEAEEALVFQIVGQNLQITQGDQSYPPCEKKTGFALEDGPTFCQRRTKKSKKIIGECHFDSLQNLEKPAHIRLVLRHGDSKVVVCPGVMRFPIPITYNYPGFVILDKRGRQGICSCCPAEDEP